MSNLAKKIQQEEQQNLQQQTTITPKPVAPKKHTWLSPGEKALMFAFGVLFCIGAAFIISKQSDIYHVNKEIQLVESSIQDQQKVNGDLEMQIDELSRYERIKEQAEKLGLTLNENNVKVVQGQ
ncbi:cell division protein FtsL [Mesobacillus maritimus]|uniref:cell division protein FtsL n=1 Tax=Mesobacillus maritimus TaxID=1643336 RepID=UPI00203F983C|nr:cell division protein FtsL [Mesobacillus maritimus]MCM3587088.1 cell division protein FtsL [Mesobacillus maritimus]MCM3667653.1 cell division protein FtsL [Mesobacillus maritimus]